MLKKIKERIGIFFGGKKDNETDSERAEEMLKLYLKYIPQLKGMMNGQQSMDSDGKIIGMMYDYYANAEENTMTGSQFDAITTDSNGVFVQKKDERIVALPIEVMSELETVPTPFDLKDLDEKISTLKDKSKLSNQRYAKAQIDGLCKRLENRKQYRDNVEFYSQFPNTTDEKIDKLLSKYKLKMETSDLFIPTFPKEAIDIMKKYTEVTERITGEKPIYYVIAEEKDFAKKREKLDPILLAQSPFGFYWNVLGVWGAEMLLLHEI